MPPALHTEICDLLGIRYPIIQTGMGWVAKPDIDAYLEQLQAWRGPFDDVEATINRSKLEPFCPAWCEAAHRGAWRSAPEPSGN